MYLITIDLFKQTHEMKVYLLKSCFHCTTHTTNIETVGQLFVTPNRQFIEFSRSINSFEIEELEAILEKIKTIDNEL